ncbi:hypothetical protein DPM19_13040 [Actinomadura craniellae]|uniref:Histidine kinase/HSP90-like ATPase domain-containing protein n=1 Tax=Actinomadura craniellae TaxID=2231787 RepID=A0A365H6D2_9ACTN|nr:ATP-binding protein [Actinomadura craniellae]RAY14674.1 hypothetical protein DPM19_13040 [Actinomadura craniellae]
MKTPCPAIPPGPELPSGLRNGGCSAWRLPEDERCAAAGRRLIRTELTRLDLPDDLVHDVALAVSELATNGLLHGLGRDARGRFRRNGGPLELWAYHRWTPVSELVIKVYDPDTRWREPAGKTGPHAEHGRGVQIVEALAWAWGRHLTRSRLARQAVPGKAVWFTVPIPPPYAPARPGSARQAAEALHSELAARGLPGLRREHGDGTSLVSLPNRTIWTGPPGAFRWRNPAGGYVHRPLTDLVDVAEDTVRHHEEMTAPALPASSKRRDGERW